PHHLHASSPGYIGSASTIPPQRSLYWHFSMVETAYLAFSTPWFRSKDPSGGSMSTAAVTPDPRYPIGAFELPESFTEADRKSRITDIEALPRKMREAVKDLSQQQL